MEDALEHTDINTPFYWKFTLIRELQGRASLFFMELIMMVHDVHFHNHLEFRTNVSDAGKSKEDGGDRMEVISSRVRTVESTPPISENVVSSSSKSAENRGSSGKLPREETGVISPSRHIQVLQDNQADDNSEDYCSPNILSIEDVRKRRN
ncbi:17206_t:CDS:2 [Acaulospora morrowiae]|uniref:17206_t:CDS:1 n=1 Tax=Acaulospora morrowiae TaxID=94023 RepID=A0A9N8WR74_9GLOM|nr:17206_t:CDS:2 [Acaulospora morrowiae]